MQQQAQLCSCQLIQNIDDFSRHTYKLWVLGVTSMLTRLPTVVARPRPPPPEELYKKVGYTPMANSLNIQPYRVSPPNTTVGRRQSSSASRSSTSLQAHICSLHKGKHQRALPVLQCPHQHLKPQPQLTALCWLALHHYSACASPLLRNTQHKLHTNS